MRPRLAVGSRVAVVAPAGPYPAAELELGVALLQSRGYRVQRLLPAPPPPVTEPTLPGYLAASDEARLSALSQGLLDPDFDAVWAARGGYGVMRLLARLPWTALAGATPRLVLGFSDLTALLCPLLSRCPAWSILHAPNVVGLSRLDPEQRRALWALLEQGTAPAWPTAGLTAWAGGRASGPLLGGNLCLLAHLAGTPYLPPAHGAVLLLEEVGERPYRLDRMVTQLALAGWLDGVAGVLLGELRGCDEGELSGEAVLAARLAELVPGVPVVGGLPVGHGARNLALPLGRVVQLQADPASRQASLQWAATGAGA